MQRPMICSNGIPVIPVRRDFREHVAHDLRARHEPVLLAVEDADFALAHEFAEPADVGDGDTRVFAAVVNDDGAIDVFIAKADCLFGFEAHDEVGSGIRVGSGAVPDGKSQTLVEGVLALAFGEGESFLRALYLIVVGAHGFVESQRVGMGQDLVHEHH